MKRSDATKTDHRILHLLFRGEKFLGQTIANDVLVLKALLGLLSEVSFAEEDAQGQLVPVSEDQISWHAATLQLQHGSARPETLRGSLANLATEAMSRERPPRPASTVAAPHTPGEREQHERADLTRQESEAAERLRTARNRREEYEQKMAAGDIVSASEIVNNG